MTENIHNFKTRAPALPDLKNIFKNISKRSKRKNIQISPYTNIRLSMNTHIGKVCSKACRGLYNIRQIRKYLSAESTKCLIHAFVTSHLDYCNALLYKLPQYQYDRLQKVLNAAARVTCLIPKFAHITPVLRELHWLPVKFRVEFKIALLVFKTLNGLAPQYLSELLVVKPRTRYSLRSDSETLLVIPKVTRKTFGDRAFFRAGPTEWNALPSSLRNCRNIDSLKYS